MIRTLMPQSTRIRVARDAAPYLLAKYQAIAQVNEQDLGVKLDQAMEESGKVINGRAAEIKELPKPVSELSRSLKNI
jgi:hypothetical protein